MCRVCYQVFQLTSNLVVRGFGVLVLFCVAVAVHFSLHMLFSVEIWENHPNPQPCLCFLFHKYASGCISLSLSSFSFLFSFFFFFFFILVFQLGVLSCYGVSGFRTCNSFACLRLQAVFITETNNEA